MIFLDVEAEEKHLQKSNKAPAIHAAAVASLLANMRPVAAVACQEWRVTVVSCWPSMLGIDFVLAHDVT